MLALLAAVPAAAETAVVAVSGQVEVLRNGAVAPAAAGQAVQPGARLRTGANSGAELLVGSLMLARLSPNAEVEPAEQGNPSLRMHAGQARIAVAGRVEIRAGRFGVSSTGGEFLVSLDAAGGRICKLSGIASPEQGGSPLEDGQCLRGGGQRVVLADESSFPVAGPLAPRPALELTLERPVSEDLAHLRSGADDEAGGADSREGSGGSMCLDSGAEGAGGIEQVEGPDIERDREVEVTVTVKLKRE